MSPAMLRLIADVLEHCARLDLGFDIPIPPDLTDEECALLDDALGRGERVFAPGEDADDEQTSIALAVLVRRAAAEVGS